MFLTRLLLRSAGMCVPALCFLALSRLAGQAYAPKWRCRTWYILFAGFLLPLPSISLPAVAAGPVFAAAQTDRFPALLLLWLGGALAILLTTLLRHVRFLRAVRRCSVPRGKLLVTPLITSPMAVGLFRPRILLPDTPCSKEELRWILRHEMTHIRRRDNLFQLLLCLCRAVHWFNPVVWLLLRAAAQDCEEACDAAALQGATPAERHAYCAALLRVAARGTRTTALAMPMCRGGAGLKRRMSAALYGGVRRPFRAMTALMAALVLCCGLLFGVQGATFSASTKNIVPSEMPPEITEPGEVVYTTVYDTEPVEVPLPE